MHQYVQFHLYIWFELKSTLLRKVLQQLAMGKCGMRHRQQLATLRILLVVYYCCVTISLSAIMLWICKITTIVAQEERNPVKNIRKANNLQHSKATKRHLFFFKFK